MSTTDHPGLSPDQKRQSTLDRLRPVRGTLDGVGTRYSRTVNLLKYGLPVVALLVVLVVIGWPGVQRETEGFRLTFSSFVQDQDGAPGMLNARFVGSDKANRPFVITAESARQNPKHEGFVRLNNLQADLTLSNGVWLTMTASQGDYNSDVRSLLLAAPVDIFSDVGYEFHAGDTTVNLKENEARSDQPVNGQGAFGNIQANSFVMSESGQRMKFIGDVKMLLMPKRRSGQ
jgi:lipopolysaccharide export system protein LptC